MVAKNRPKARARNLGGEDIEAIVSILDGWDGKLTWELLIDVVEQRLSARYTRQAPVSYTHLTLPTTPYV